MMVAILYFVGMDTHFFLTVVPVEGTTSIPPSEIVAVSGLGGVHVFAADPTKVAQQISDMPGVISSTVTLSWPNQVHIQIKEDTPIAIWREGNMDYWVTGDGRIIPSRMSIGGLLQIISELPPEFETAVETDGEDTSRAALDFIPEDVLSGALLLRQLRPNINKLYYRPSGGLSYEDGRGWRGYFGVGSDMGQKLVVYETIVEELLTRGLSPVYISVSNQEKPYYMAR